MDDFPRHYRFELPSASAKLGLRYSPVVILVELGNLRRVLHRQGQCCLQAARAWGQSARSFPDPAPAALWMFPLCSGAAKFYPVGTGNR